MSSCGPAREKTPPNGVGWHLKAGQGRASPGKPQDRGFKLGIARVDDAPELALTSGHFVYFRFKNALLLSRDRGDFLSPRIGTDIWTFLLMFSPLVLVGTLLSMF